MRRMNIYRDKVERVSGWETSRIRMATKRHLVNVANYTDQN